MRRPIAIAIVLGVAGCAGILVASLSKGAPVVTSATMTLLTSAVGAALYLLARQARRGRGGRGTRPDLKEAAAAHGLEPPAGVLDPAWLRRLRDVPGVPDGAAVANLLAGEVAGRPVLLYELEYVVFTGQAAIPVSRVVCRAEAPMWPEVHLAPRSLLGRWWSNLRRGRGSLHLESQEFNTRLAVKSRHEDFAITLLSPPIQEFMLRKRDACWHIGRGRVSINRAGPLRPEHIAELLQRMTEFWSLVEPELLDW